MSYMTQSHIAENIMMFKRVAQCAAQQGIGGTDPPTGMMGSNADQWTEWNKRTWSSAPGWDDAWEYALLTHEDNPDYDPGTDESVITDDMILSQVQAMLTTPEEPVVTPQEVEEGPVPEDGGEPPPEVFKA